MIKQINITTPIIECLEKDLEKDDAELVESAKKFLPNAYAPYSKFSVAVALRLENGNIINGSNQENAASPSGTCAERTAIFFANSQYPTTKIKTIAIVALFNGDITKYPITPCGACRQVILETEKRFSSPIKTILVGKDKTLIINSIKDILPLSFTDTFFE